jgi:hypothetical protein
MKPLYFLLIIVLMTGCKTKPFVKHNASQALYKLTVDVDAYPRYNMLIIDGAAIAIRPYEK